MTTETTDPVLISLRDYATRMGRTSAHVTLARSLLEEGLQRPEMLRALAEMTLTYLRAAEAESGSCGS
jgi:hypothetical protein